MTLKFFKEEEKNRILNKKKKKKKKRKNEKKKKRKRKETEELLSCSEWLKKQNIKIKNKNTLIFRHSRNVQILILTRNGENEQ